jgi:hypothetical protein
MVAARHTATGSDRSRVSAPAAATVVTAPSEAANHSESVNTGYKTVEESTTAIAEVTVILAFSVTRLTSYPRN